MRSLYSKAIQSNSFICNFPKMQSYLQKLNVTNGINISVRNLQSDAINLSIIFETYQKYETISAR